MRRNAWTGLILVALWLTGWVDAGAGEPRLVSQTFDPYGFPRPGDRHEHVPVRTSFFAGVRTTDAADPIDRNSLQLEIRPAGGETIPIVQANQLFAPGWKGRIYSTSLRRLDSTAIYATPTGDNKLLPLTTYTAILKARTRSGANLPGGQHAWSFTTEAAPEEHAVEWDLDLTEGVESVPWHGGFFTGFVKTGFTSTEYYNRGPANELMAQTQRWGARAFTLERDWWLDGMEHQPDWLPPFVPNLVRELETRRVKTMIPVTGGVRLIVEDFYGHEQYGIPSGRPLAGDYAAGDRVLVADGEKYVHVAVTGIDDSSASVYVEPFDTSGWKIAYSGTNPTVEDPRVPGLFPKGGTYLRKLDPPGTPRYYWGRVHKEWDDVHGRLGRRLVVNVTSGVGDLTLTGRNFVRPKNWVQHHDVVRTITDHLIERYGDACLDFVWSIGNEPELANSFWRDAPFTDWLRFYDYTCDAVLRAFEDRGYDSSKVFIGGLESAGAAANTEAIASFLAHGSPTAVYSGPGEGLEENAAYNDPLLDGKRSQRVEALCSAHEGHGSPVDFISVHCYKSAENMGNRILQTKETALALDPGFYEDLWVNSHESVMSWLPPDEPGARESFLGNGYFCTWVADVAYRLLSRAAEDGRYGFGETILTFWQWGFTDFHGQNDVVQNIRVDRDGNGSADETITVAMPILHFLGVLNGMEHAYRLLPLREIEGHRVAGFAAPHGDTWRVLMYSHQPIDTQTRTDHSFEATLRLMLPPWPRVRVDQYRFDRAHNTFYPDAVHYLDIGRTILTTPEFEDLSAKSVLRASQQDVFTNNTPGLLELRLPLASNGVNFLVLREDTGNAAQTWTGYRP